MTLDRHSNAIILEPEIPATSAVIWLHGLGADGYDFAGIAPQLKLAEPLSVRFIFPHAPIRPVTLNSGTRMRAWYDVVEIRTGAFEDEEGIRASEKILCDLIEQQEKQEIPSARIVLAGFSQGGVIALHCGLRYSKPLAGILALSTYLPLAHKLPAEFSESNRTTPIFIGHGINDDVIPIAWGRNSRQILIQRHYSVAWHEYSMAHSVCPEEVRDIGQFLRQILT
jgi:phospholipase/carboxylesterase